MMHCSRVSAAIRWNVSSSRPGTFAFVTRSICVIVGAAGWGYTVLWDVDTIDWKPESDGGPSTQAIIDKVVDRAHGGSIVLMHLGGFNTFEALPDIVAGLQAKGLEPVTLGEMFDLEALAADCAGDGVWEFLFSAPPLRVAGGVGSPLNPLAVK